MKQLANLVSFDPVGKIVVFQATKFFHAPSLETLLLVVNTTRNEIIYNLADPELGAEDFGVTGSPSGPVYTLNLKAPCTGHASTDSISIFYDDKIDTNDWVQGPDIPVVRTILYANDSGGIDNNGQIVSSNNPLPVSGTVTANVTFPASQPTVSTPVRIIQIPGTAPGISNEVLPQNLSRRYLLIQNLSNAPFYINFSGTATPSSLRIDGLGSLTFESGVVPTNAIQMLRSTADQSYAILHA